MMDENKGVLRRYMICQQCGKRWEGIDPDCARILIRAYIWDRK